MVEHTGTVSFSYGDEVFYTWYKIVGDLKSGVRSLMTLHSGPGISHHYMLAHVELMERTNASVVFYDQIGIGQSKHLPKKPNDFWTVEFFMDELENLLAHLGIEDDFDLLGHSWGGMLGSQFAAMRAPKGLKHLLIANCSASMELSRKAGEKLIDTLPEDVREAIRRHQRDGTTDSDEYKEAMKVYNKRHICMLDPWPEDLLKSFSAKDDDPTVYTAMISASDTDMMGTLRNWTIASEAHNIVCPTLLVNAENDLAQDLGVMPFFKEIPHVKWMHLSQSTHVPFYEESDRYFNILDTFLKVI
ncbi:proline-specific peptidase [Laetiporus sulphureus 93-53]|uniref:Proline-specific peptidase n=1 Tax=Laetiporus sulphureus 93-53 TaxID=1314785 RepID=A0A165BWC5_9APHY|nr:proline-specific peptidase [Laetiporus sulphureus 93-53]KZT01770.1 proline-specific peptidase [Laetiporus sulphureus 93-53]